VISGVQWIDCKGFCRRLPRCQLRNTVTVGALGAHDVVQVHAHAHVGRAPRSLQDCSSGSYGLFYCNERNPKGCGEARSILVLYTTKATSEGADSGRLTASRSRAATSGK
jgi:hypothetical protein